ncbi:SEFIR domain-containing protein [Pedobacter hartonius]|uniref:SEFIR domain-containing protein n=1 Tax=Pedobacter hartonius TaxID=425514 RepID=A0A1H4HI65_9SPHI|nr:SEFIR domain-containing protein [Pedobacter hartonius]SEB21513.1 SEFIR domain-containing protein [Pedobacter hartonius]
MNELYDIAPEGQEPDSSLQLRHLGSRRIMATFSIPRRNDYGERTYSRHSVDRDVKASDYDGLFANMIFKTNPPYDIELLLDHHYRKFVEANHNDHKMFLRHIKYVVIPILEKRKQHQIYVGLVNEWLDQIRELDSTRDKTGILENQEVTVKSNFENQSLKKDISMDDAFISYSWDNEEHEEKVLEFTEHLRKNGYDAKIDKMISQQETATNFVKMMHQAMLKHKKIIIVLSEGYKKKAETFTGGVGEEYQLLLNDISKNPKKYILVSFQGRSDEIVPFGLQGRDITDLSRPDGLDTLYHKLSGTDKYIFSEVAPEKPDLKSINISDFKAVDPAKVIQIENPSIVLDGSGSQGGIYKEIEFKVVFAFKNISGKSIEGFAYEIKIKRELIPKSYYESVHEGYYIIGDSISSKLFPNATAKTDIFDVKINAHAIHQILGTVITVMVHTDYGTHTREFQVEEMFKVRQPNQNWGEPAPLTRELFL